MNTSTVNFAAASQAGVSRERAEIDHGVIDPQGLADLSEAVEAGGAAASDHGFREFIVPEQGKPGSALSVARVEVGVRAPAASTARASSNTVGSV